ncbi:MAG TPA: DUF3800 domain-containing protein [Thermoanaerobaculia bacterium]|nr:DUF3800 domain-containing protein [Thermoanaerobaculia bacterium]
MEDASHRFLCLLGCWFRGRDLRVFHEELERFKQTHIPHNPDEPVILHREDIVNRRRAFWRLRNPETAGRFDTALLDVITAAEFRIVAVVIDKLALKQLYAVPAHPYHLAMGFLLQRYCGYLNHVNRRGDVLAESRGGHEDRLLKDSYSRVYERGAWMTNADFFQKALTTSQLKLKPKTSNIAGVQLADMLAHPVKQALLVERGLVLSPLSPFATRLVAAVEVKFNRHLYQGRVEGYGKVFYPKK